MATDKWWLNDFSPYYRDMKPPIVRFDLFRELFGRIPSHEELRGASHVAWNHFEDLMAPLPKREEKSMASEPVDKSMMVMDKADIHIRYVPGREAPYILSIVKRSDDVMTPLRDMRIQMSLHGAELSRLVDMLDPRLIEADSTINGCNKKLREAVIAKEKAEVELAVAKTKPKRTLIVRAAGNSILFTDATYVWEDEERKTLCINDADSMTMAEFPHYDYWMWSDPDEGKSKNGEW